MFKKLIEWHPSPAPDSDQLDRCVLVHEQTQADDSSVDVYLDSETRVIWRNDSYVDNGGAAISNWQVSFLDDAR